MTKDPTIADKDMLVGEALNLMNRKKITSLFICEKKNTSWNNSYPRSTKVN